MSIGYFCAHLVTIVVLIELYHMAPFATAVRLVVSVYTRELQIAAP